LIVVSFHPTAAAAATTATATVAIVVVHQRTTRACEVQQLSHFGVWFLRGRLQFLYWFAIFISVCNFHISLQFSCHDSSTSYVCGFTWITCHYELELINSTSATVLCGSDKEKLELSKIDYYLLMKSS
jgi:hypothetical protein